MNGSKLKLGAREKLLIITCGFTLSFTPWENASISDYDLGPLTDNVSVNVLQPNVYFFQQMLQSHYPHLKARFFKQVPTTALSLCGREFKPSFLPLTVIIKRNKPVFR